MKRGIFLLVFSALPFFTFSQEIEKNLQIMIDSIYSENPEAVGIMVHVEAPKYGVSWSGSIGYSNKDQKTILEADQPALIASNIKTYVPATILKLVEKSELTIESPSKMYLSPKTISLFENKGYLLDSIRIKHLLSHTSGIRNDANSDYIKFVDQHKQYRWTRDEQLNLVAEASDTLSNPGYAFSYTDVNYLLLTEIIENIVKKPFYTAMRELLQYDELGLNSTWFPTLEEKPEMTKSLVHQYWAEYKWDSYDLDPSFDLYGGGGIACNTKDLAMFNYHLFNHNIINDTTVFNLIYTKIHTNSSWQVPYYLGISESSIVGYTEFGHGGFWGTIVAYFPKLDASISVFILEKDKRSLRDDVLKKTVQILKENTVYNNK